LPEHFGYRNSGAESPNVPRKEDENDTWKRPRQGADGYRSAIIRRTRAARWAVPPRFFTRASDIGDGQSLAPLGEWVSAGYSGEGMVHARMVMCPFAHALVLMVLGL